MGGEKKEKESIKERKTAPAKHTVESNFESGAKTNEGHRNFPHKKNEVG